MRAPRTARARRRQYRIERAIARFCLVLGLGGIGLWIGGHLNHRPAQTWPARPRAHGAAGLQEMVRPAYMPTPARPVYRFSVIRAGAYNREELQQALAADSIAARHYAGFDAAQARAVPALRQAVYVSYRRGNNIYWTSHPVMLARGEPLLTDGTNLARARCGNRISTKRMSPTEFSEPPEVGSDADSDSALEAPDAPTLLPPVGSAPELVAEIFPPGIDSGSAAANGGVPVTVATPGASGSTPGGYLWFPAGSGFGLPLALPQATPAGTDAAPPQAGGETSPTDIAGMPQPSSEQPEQPWQCPVFPPYVWNTGQGVLPPLVPASPQQPPPMPIYFPSTIVWGANEWSETPSWQGSASGGSGNSTGTDTPGPPPAPTSSTTTPEFSNLTTESGNEAVPEPALTMGVAALLAALVIGRFSRRAGARC